MDAETRKQIAIRYDLTIETIKNWLKLETPERPAPWDDPIALPIWVEQARGRRPKQAFLDRCHLLACGGEPNAKPAEIEGSSIDQLELGAPKAGPAPAIAGPALPAGAGSPKPNSPQTGGLESAIQAEIGLVIEALGLSESLARVLQEERRTWAAYQAALSEENEVLATRLRADWLKLTEAKRAIHKTPDAVETAKGLMAAYLRGEWEREARELKRLLGSRLLGAEFKTALERGEEFESAWDQELERVWIQWLDTTKQEPNQ